MASELPQAVAAFIREHINSVLQLEILLLLEQPRLWSSQEIAAELRVSAGSAELRLRDLRARCLIERGPTPDLYTYAPAGSLGVVVDSLAECYASSRYTVTNLMFSDAGCGDAPGSPGGAKHYQDGSSEK